jgi:hypothetical protein
MLRRAEALALLLCAIPAFAAAAPQNQTVDVGGDISLLALTMPNQPEGGTTHELRSRARIEVTADPSTWLRLKFEGTVDGLVADRAGRVDDVIVRAREAWVEARGARADVRMGYGRLVWGRLDEIMPSDVLNPLETSRYFLEGRAEARLPIAFARGRVFVDADTSIEAIVSLPGRRGRFDELDEPTSPFNLLRDLPLPPGAAERLTREEPDAAWDSLQVGGRVSTTLGRVDTSVSVYRGYEPFGALSLEPTGLVERYSRFTMVAADAETIVGAWAVRAEAAYFPDKEVTSGIARAGRAFDVGAGVDRSAGDYRLFASAVWHRDWTTEGAATVNHDLSLIGSIERRFSRDRYLARVFGVVNPVDNSGFIRGVLAWSVRDNVALEASGGVFFGPENGTDTFSRFRSRDFGFVRLRWFF